MASSISLRKSWFGMARLKPHIAPPSIGHLSLTIIGQLSKLLDMEQNPLITEIEAYCATAGISPSTLGVRAVGNSRLFDRLKRRDEEGQRLADRVRAYMAANPASSNANEAAE